MEKTEVEKYMDLAHAYTQDDRVKLVSNLILAEAIRDAAKTIQDSIKELCRTIRTS